MPITAELYAFTTKPVKEWNMMDLHLFYDHAEEIASDGDLATKRPELREMALGILERKMEREKGDNHENQNREEM